MNEKLNEYREKFGEPLPMMFFRCATDDEIIKVIDSCLESGKPYEPELEEGAAY